MSKMMETAKDDKEMMSGMCKSMMENQENQEMMEKIKSKNTDMKKMEKKPVKKEDHKSHH